MNPNSDRAAGETDTRKSTDGAAHENNAHDAQSAPAHDDDEGTAFTSSYEYEETECSTSYTGSSSYFSGDDSNADDDDAEEEEQENLLSFSTFTTPFELDGHRLMTLQAFRKTMLIGTNQGTVAVLRLPLAPKLSTSSSSGAEAQRSGTGMGTETVSDAAAQRGAAPPRRPSRQPKLLHLLQNHADPISDVGCNTAETFVISSDKAGYVVVQNTTDLTDVWRRQMEVPIQSVAMHPEYDTLDDKPLMCVGADKVYLVTKLVFLSHRRTTLVAERSGKVASVRWSPSGHFVAWVTERGLTIYNYLDQVVVRTIGSPVVSQGPTQGLSLQEQHRQQQQLARRLELYPPTLLWETFAPGTGSKKDTNTLICGWGDWVQQVRIREVAPAKPGVASAGSGAAGLAPEVRAYRVEGYTGKALRPSATENPYRVCGIAPFGTDRYLILASIGDANAGEGVMRDLEIRVVHRFTLEDLYRGRMMVDYAHPLQLALACHFGVQEVARVKGAPPAGKAASTGPASPPSTSPARSALYPPPDTVYYVLSVDNIVQASPCDEDDHVDFLLRTRRYEEAYRYALTHRLQRHETAPLAQRMLTALLADPRQAHRVLALLPECIGATDAAEWERWIFVYDQRGESWKLVDALPTQDGPQTERNRQKHQDPGAGGGAPSPSRGLLPARPTPAKGTVMPTSSSIGKEYYDLVLLRALEHDPVVFNTAVHRFEGLFNVDVVAKAAEMKYHEYNGLVMAGGLTPVTPTTDALSRGQRGHDVTPPAPTLSKEEVGLKALTEAYGRLLRLMGRNEEALQVLLKVDDSDELFLFIRQTGLYQKALELLPDLFMRSKHRTVTLLLEHTAQPSTLSSKGSTGLASSSSSSAKKDVSGNTTHRQGSVAVLPFAPGSASDPLAPESVVRRLEKTDRVLLWTYLNALRKHNKPAFTTVAKRNAQLVATLFIDYNRQELLPFLRDMSMYLDRIKEVYALCKKHKLLDEVAFLLARMGKEEEGLKVLVQHMKNMRQAVAYVNEVPTREEQALLFRKLVQLAIETNAQLPVNPSDGSRYVSHDTEIGDTFTSIAARYGVPESLVREANGGMTAAGGNGGFAGMTPPGTPGSRGSATCFNPSQPSSSTKRAGSRHMLRHYAIPRSPLTPAGFASGGGSSANSSMYNVRAAGNGSNPSRGADTTVALSHASSMSDGDVSGVNTSAHDRRPPPRPCIVPLNMLSALLTAAADPLYADNPSIDATYLIRALPEGETIPHVGAYIAAVTRSRAAEEGFVGTILQTAERDLANDYGGLLRRRVAAIRLDPTGRTSGSGVTGGMSRKLSPSLGRAGSTNSRNARALGVSATRRDAGSAAATSATAGLRSSPMSCGVCGQRVPLSLAKTLRPILERASLAANSTPSQQREAEKAKEEGEAAGGLVVFACEHVYHPKCVVTLLAGEGLLAEHVEVNKMPLSDFFEHPEVYLRNKNSTAGDPAGVLHGGGVGRAAARSKGVPFCRLCSTGVGASGGLGVSSRVK